MSWWDAKSISGFATQALKSAQKKIDKVLDIDVGEPDYDEEQHSGSQQEEEFLSGVMTNLPNQDTVAVTDDSWKSWTMWDVEDSSYQTLSDATLVAHAVSLPYEISLPPTAITCVQKDFSTSVYRHTMTTCSPRTSVVQHCLMNIQQDSADDECSFLPKERAFRYDLQDEDSFRGCSMSGNSVMVINTSGMDDGHVILSDEHREYETEQMSSCSSKDAHQSSISEDTEHLFSESTSSRCLPSEVLNIESCTENVAQDVDNGENVSVNYSELEGCHPVGGVTASLSVPDTPPGQCRCVNAPPCGREHGHLVVEDTCQSTMAVEEHVTASLSVPDTPSGQCRCVNAPPCGREHGHLVDEDTCQSTMAVEEVANTANQNILEIETDIFAVEPDPSSNDLHDSKSALVDIGLSLLQSPAAADVRLSKSGQNPSLTYATDSVSLNAAMPSHAIDRSYLLDVIPQREDTMDMESLPSESTAVDSSNESLELSCYDNSTDTIEDRPSSGADANVSSPASSSMEDAASVRMADSHQWLEDCRRDILTTITSPSASFVKCMIEDAMSVEEVTKIDDSSSDVLSEVKSECSKVDSEFDKSVCSGHESSDDVETAASSDIEIISTPTSNGDRNGVDLSPLQFTLQKAASRHSHSLHSSDSQSSSSVHSRGNGDCPSKEREAEENEHQMCSQSEGDTSCQEHEQNLLKKLADVSQVLHARESKLVQLSKDNDSLVETNTILRRQLQHAEEPENCETATNLHTLTEEFSRRMAESERRLQSVVKEKEAIRQELSAARGQLSNRSTEVKLEAMIVEKDRHIKDLMEEGEKLSKDQLRSSNTIKMLRSKEKDGEGLMSSLRTKHEHEKDEKERLKLLLDSKRSMERKQSDDVKQLMSSLNLSEKENHKLKVELEVVEGRCQGLQHTLDDSYMQIAELNRSIATHDCKMRQCVLSVEVAVREEMKMALQQQTMQHDQQRQSLVLQIEDLRMSMNRIEKESTRREEMFKQEIDDLHTRLQEDEGSKQDLSHSITSASWPLLRQIESLHATHGAQLVAWEKVERTLTERLVEAQNLLAMSQEKERSSDERLVNADSRCSALQLSNTNVCQEKAHLSAQLTDCLHRLQVLEACQSREGAKLELDNQTLRKELSSLHKDKALLEVELESVLCCPNQDGHMVLMEEFDVKQTPDNTGLNLGRERVLSGDTTVSTSVQDLSGHHNSPLLHQRASDSNGTVTARCSQAQPTLYDTVRNAGAATLIESLHSQLKLKEGEIGQLQAEILQLELTRESLAREMVNLANENEQLQHEVHEMSAVDSQHKDMESRYTALLQMYGEKEEMMQELVMDLEDVKDMYRHQINALLK